MKIFLCGDVMTGRGIDQILPEPVPPNIYEPYITDARQYIKIAENVNGPIPYPVDYSYIWGDALAALNNEHADIRIINLETSITRSEDFWKGKEINYRMSPQNAQCLTVAKIDCCVLSNNHIIDWGYDGLNETLAVLDQKSIAHTGAGSDLPSSEKPAILQTADKNMRVIVFGLGHTSSGIPDEWGSSISKPGIAFIDHNIEYTIERIATQVNSLKKDNDIAMVSIHWGDNWGYDIPTFQKHIAHLLIDHCKIDCIHGHSSHHVKGMEIYHGKPVFYGCGDLINDYEGISGYEEYRGDFSFLYLLEFDNSGRFDYCKMIPMHMASFRLNYCSKEDMYWLKNLFDRPSFIENGSIHIEENSFILKQ